MATIENRLADPVSVSRMRCTSSVLLKGFFSFFKIVLLSVAVALALSI